MAIKQGRCSNCGSIIKVDDSKDEAVCMFCWAHTPTSVAIDIDKHPQDFEFPNEEQPEPKPEDHAAAFISVPGAHAVVPAKKSQPSIKKKKPEKISPAEKVAQSKKELITPTLTRGSKLGVLAGFLGAIALLAAISIPLATSRNAHREILKANISSIYTEGKLDEASYTFEGQNNQNLTLVIPQAVDDKAALQLMENYKREREKAYNLSSTDSQSYLKLLIYSKEGLVSVDGKGELKTLNKNN